MKLALLAVSAMVAVASAQSTWYLDLPPCAQDCAKKAAEEAKCDTRDLKCLCNSRIFPQVFQDCVYSNCGSVVGPAAYDLWKKYCYNSTTTIKPTSTDKPTTTFNSTTIYPTTTVKPTTTFNSTTIYPTTTVKPTTSFNSTTTDKPTTTFTTVKPTETTVKPTETTIKPTETTVKPTETTVKPTTTTRTIKPTVITVIPTIIIDPTFTIKPTKTKIPTLILDPVEPTYIKLDD